MAETRTYNGFTYQRAGPGQPWTKAAPAGGGGAGLQPIPVTPRQQAQDARQDRAADLSATVATEQLRDLPAEREKRDIDIQNAARQGPDKAWDQAEGLRTSFESNPVVKQFNVSRDSTRAIQSLSERAKATQDPAAHIGIIFSYMKVLDPDSVVREAEYATAQNAAGVPDRIRNQYNKLLSGEFLSPEQIDDFKANAQRLYLERARGYNEFASRTHNLLRSRGVPEEMLRTYAPIAIGREGQPDPQLGEFDDVPAGLPRKPLGPGDIGAAGVPEVPPGLSAEQEAAYNAFWQANPNANADQLRAFARGSGFDLHNADEIVRYRNETGRVAPGGSAVVRPPDISDRRAINSNENELEAGVRGVADTLTLGFADELYALSETVQDGGTYDENLRRQRAIDEFDEQNNSVSRLTGQIAGGFVLPGFGATTPGRLAAVGAGYGGAYGFGSGDGSTADRLLSAAGNATVGAVAGGTFGLIGNHIGSRRGGGNGGGRRAAGVDLMNAAQRQFPTQDNLPPILPADVGGGFVRRLTGGMGQGLVAGPRIQSAAEGTVQAFQNRVANLAADEGAAQGRGALGGTVQDALEGFNARTQQEGGNLYANARELAGDSLFRGRRAFQNLNAQLRELGQTPNTSAPLMSGLSRLRDDIAGEGGLNPLDIDAIRRLRTQVRSEAQTEGLRATDYQRRAGEVLNDLAEDIASELPQEAAEEFRRADTAWRDRLQFIDDVETRLLGPAGDRSAEKVTRALVEMSRSDTRRFGQLLNQISPEEAGIIRSTLIRSMGEPPPGNPEPFSVETWARNFRQLRDHSAGTLDMLFRGQNREHANDLLTIAEGIERAARHRNFSNTGGAINTTAILQIIGSGVGGGTGGIAGAAGGLAAAGALEASLGRLLSSPRFARWLARPPQERGRAARRLGQIASREPALAADILPLQQALETTTLRAAAEQEDNGRR